MPTLRYVPDTFEQLCINMWSKWLTQHGYDHPDCPPIYLWFEKPPKLVNVVHYTFAAKTEGLVWNKIWRVMEDDDDDNSAAKARVKKSNKKGQFEKPKKLLSQNHSKRRAIRENMLSRDKVLFRYYSNFNEIVLNAPSISDIAKAFKISTKILRTVLLMGEVEQWVLRCIADREDKMWNEWYFSFDDDTPEPKKLKELWEHFYAYWSNNEAEGLSELVSETLKHYHTISFDAFQKYKESSMFDEQSMPHHQRRQDGSLQSSRKKPPSEPYNKLMMGGVFDIHTSRRN